MDTQMKLTVSKQKATLIDGYTNKHSHRLVPNEIIRLIFQFFDEVLSFHLDHATLQKFIAGHNLFTKPFTINDLTFRCALYPNKNIEKFSLQLLLPEHIESVCTYFLMYNSQHEHYWKGKALFTRFKIILAQQDKHEHDTADMKWSKFNLPLLECNNEQALNLDIWPQVISIKYRQQADCELDTERMDYHLDIRMKSHVRYTWKVSQSELSRWIGCDVRGFYAEDFPVEHEKYRNWIFTMIPNGINESCKGCVLFILDAVRMPCKIKSINESCKGCVLFILDAVRMPCKIKSVTANWKLTADFTDGCEGSYTFGNGRQFLLKTWKKARSSNDMFKELESVEITVQIDLVSVVDWNDVVIERGKWTEYGIDE
eukprot:CAMPEP_0197077104 /NCGR_PEP_ID=MMETSP1384-20130603/212452_1 /TAXON_ID=29189 /ORGANISM="Ammonia sp." /LENGTH=370 /DNA_ID=CAMNT_0042515963 /DNA_START=25 /DNA_END=1137 /DNA_ORIENTATION=+